MRKHDKPLDGPYVTFTLLYIAGDGEPFIASWNGLLSGLGGISAQVSEWDHDEAFAQGDGVYTYRASWVAPEIDYTDPGQRTAISAYWDIELLENERIIRPDSDVGISAHMHEIKEEIDAANLLLENDTNGH